MRLQLVGRRFADPAVRAESLRHRLRAYRRVGALIGHRIEPESETREWRQALLPSRSNAVRLVMASLTAAQRRITRRS